METYGGLTVEGFWRLKQDEFSALAEHIDKVRQARKDANGG